MGGPGTQQLLPSITGNQAYDRLIRSSLLVVSGGLSAWIVAWLKARGFSDPNIAILVPGAVFSALIAVAIVAWGWINGKNTEAAAEQVLVAGVTAGIHLTASGKALAADGATVIAQNDGTMPPKPVTVATAKEIIKDFGVTTGAS